MKRKRKNPIPILLLWSKKEQLRFIDAVEKVVSASRDLAAQVDELRTERQAAQKKSAGRKKSSYAAQAEAELANAVAAVNRLDSEADAPKGGGS